MFALRRHPFGRAGTPSALTQVRILGDRQIDIFNAMCALRGRRPHELAADLVLDAIREARKDPAVRQLVDAIETYQTSTGTPRPTRHLRVVGDDTELPAHAERGRR